MRSSRGCAEQCAIRSCVLNDAAYHETRRLGASGGGELAEWRALAGALGRMSEAEQRRKLEELARQYAWDVAGNFDPRVYKFASKAIAPLIGVLLSPRTTLRNLVHSFDLTSLDGRIGVQGPREHVRKLCTIGTVIHVPTHLSNLDSVVFGFALERAGLPPPPTAPARTSSRTPSSASSCTTWVPTGSTAASSTASTRTSSSRTRASSSSAATTRSSFPAGPARAAAASSGS